MMPWSPKFTDNNMVRVLHLLSDYKFAEGHIYRFTNARFDNTYVFIAEKDIYEGVSASKLQQVKPFSREFEHIATTASSFDIVFVYNLDYLKSYIVNRIDKKVVVIWYFYGTELYNALPAFKYSIYSKKTKSLLGINGVSILLQRFKRIASFVKYALLRRVPTYTETARAMRRVDYLTTFSKEEYDYLQAHCAYRLPAFLSLPVSVRDEQKGTAPAQKNNSLLLSHSATPDCNHADIIDLLSGCGYTGDVIVPLSYGENEHYTRLIRERLTHSGLRVEVLEAFMERKAYTEKMNACGAAVFNSYRQLALGNIFLSLRNNLKVYLNEYNPSYTWLLNKGFIIFSVQKDLERDIKSSRLLLLAGEAAANTRVYEDMNDPVNNQVFLQQLEEMATQRRKAD
jgi:dTDP-N-acetylfucosamine:lipid II N-acetylfucosaminyltransferase